MNNVDIQSTEYQKDINSWEKVRDCVEGSKAVKAKTTIYLPQPSPSDNNAKRYESYLLRANFVNVTARTLNGLAGAVLRKPPKIDLPPQLEYMEVDSDGSGCSIFQSSKETLSDVIQVGRAGLLVDFPAIEGDTPVTLQEEQSLNLRASILKYKAESIINWKEVKVGAETILKMVVLTETEDLFDENDPFQNKTITVYRLLALDKSGNYYQEEYIQSSETGTKGTFVLRKERAYPRLADGSLLNRIPFIFIGSKDLKPTVDKSPLLDLADLNLSHYRNSADLEEMVFVVGQPTLIMTGLSQNWIDDKKRKPAKVGSRSSISLPIGADAKFIQINESQLADKVMARKEEQMVAIGARVITKQTGGVEAAESLRIKASGESSILSNIAGNVSEGYTRALRISALFMGANPEDVVFELNMDFLAEKLTPDEARMLAELWQKGIFPKADLRDALRKGELLRKDREDEDLDQEVNDEDGDTPSLGDNED